MDQNAILAEISAQSKLVDSIAINQALVTEIDRHIKETENRLNEKLVHVPAKIVIENFEPKVSKNKTATKIDDELWENFSFNKNWWNQKSLHEEISFEKTAKGYGFIFTTGEVTFDVGVYDAEGAEWYYRIIEDKRESFKVTGASADIKLRAFKYLNRLLEEISQQANQIALHYRHAPAQGNTLNRMSLNMAEAFTPAELAEIDRNYNRF